jgi:pheromone a factor receptor
MIWDIGMSLFLFHVNARPGLHPWISWENVHSNFSRVQQVPTFLIPAAVLSQLTFDWWIAPISALAFFLFFRTGEEVLSDYRVAFNWTCRIVCQQDIFHSKDHGASFLPSYMWVSTSQGFNAATLTCLFPHP